MHVPFSVPNNFHTADGRYKPFAELLRRDGYRVEALSQRLSVGKAPPNPFLGAA
jgi:hypothetical protein